MDNAATTPLDPRVLEAMMPFLTTSYGNPSSLHRGGAEPKGAVERAREQVASLVGCRPEELVFTSGATEANNLAIKGSAWASGKSRGTVLISSIEHLSVLNAAKRLQRMGYELEEIPVDADALVYPSDVEKALDDDTLLVSVNLANPEVGTIEPIREVAAIARERKVPFHCDASAAAGWIPIDVENLGVDLLTLSAHNFYGPKGAGALYVRSGVRLVPLHDGGPQEGGRRGGTENVAGVVGLGAAAELAMAESIGARPRLEKLRDGLIDGIDAGLDGVILTGHRTQRLPGHISFCFAGIEGESLLTDLDAGGIAASSGSACSSQALKVSHVLDAMGVDTPLARGSLVVTLGRDAREDEVNKAKEMIIYSARRLKEMSPF